MPEVQTPPGVENFTNSTKPPTQPQERGNDLYFRDENQRILDENANKAHVETTVNAHPDAFNPQNEQVASVLDHIETPQASVPTEPLAKDVPLVTNGAKPDEARSPFSPNRVEEMLQEIAGATNGVKPGEAAAAAAFPPLVKELPTTTNGAIETAIHRSEPLYRDETVKEAVDKVSADTQQILIELEGLKEKKDRGAFAAAARRILVRLSPLILGVSALLAQQDRMDTPVAAATPDVEPPVAQEPRSAGTDEKPLMVRPYTVESGDSISGILAKLEPKKWLDEDGSFKMDEATQSDLYTQVREIFDLNKASMGERNSELFRQMSEEETALGRKLTGPELKALVERVGGDRELVLIVPGEKITLPVNQ